MSRSAPLWLSAPTRFAALTRWQARVAILVILAVLALTITALAVPTPEALDAATGGERHQTDLMLYDAIAAGVRGGGNYYAVAADAMRAGGYPLKPFLTMRLPALASVLAALPLWAAPLLQLLLVLCVAATWMLRLHGALGRSLPMLVGGILLAGSMLAFIQPGLISFHEIWAGLLVAWSLGLRRPGRWVEPAAIALAAMLIRETATLYAVIMLVFAWRDGERREAMGWTLVLALFGVALAFHAWAVTGLAGPLDARSPGWLGLEGIGLFVKSIVLGTALQLAPLWLGALLVGASAIGWASWRDPLAARMIAIIAAYGALISIFARIDTFYWGLMVAPVFLLGLIFLPDALRDLVAQATEKRRITVTRVAR